MGVQVPLSAPNKISNLQGRDENPGLLIFPTVTVFVTITFPAFKKARQIHLEVVAKRFEGRGLAIRPGTRKPP